MRLALSELKLNGFGEVAIWKLEKYFASVNDLDAQCVCDVCVVAVHNMETQLKRN